MTVRALWTLPSIDPAYRAKCLATLKVANVLVLDNSAPKPNRGVNACWSIGIETARAIGAEWIVFFSESMRFGDAGGQDFEDRLAGDWCDAMWAWHLVAFPLTTIDRVGMPDPNLESYLGDTDLLVRLHLAGLPSPRENDLHGRTLLTNIDAHDTGTEHSIREGFAHPDLGKAHQYFERKWGSPQPHARWTHPFDDPTKDWTWWPTPPDLRSIL